MGETRSAAGMMGAKWIALTLLLLAACERRIAPFSVSHVDRTVGPSQYPRASDSNRVGTYPGAAMSGAGIFYDEVLEYRVWLHPEDGAEKKAGDQDYFAAFARYENALAFSRRSRGAEPPLVLVRQKESINEPSPGKYEWVKEERITEWKPEWLDGSLRTPTSIPRFLRSGKKTPGGGQGGGVDPVPDEP